MVADAIGRGAGGEIDLCPAGDGGEGTMEVLVEACNGTRTTAVVQDPLGRPISAQIGWIDDGATAIVEMALASGLGLVCLAERDAEIASTLGTGQLIAAAADAGARRIVVAVGGSATTDGGAAAIEAIDSAGGLRGARLVVLSDVETPFEQAAEIFGPQKGADAAAVQRLTARLNEFAATLPRDPRGVAMTGGAGGLSGGLWARYGATLEAGAPWVLDALGFDVRLARADAVVTGEGRLDRQTFEGKLVGEITRRCRAARKPVHAVVGSSSLNVKDVAHLGLEMVRIATDESAMAAAGRALRTISSDPINASNGILDGV
jgi:glycerate 2-kinase